jgi:hypothetical protein
MAHLGFLSLLAATLVVAPGDDVRLFELGRDRSPGVLLNLTAGARPCDPIDPSRPTVVVTHGLNPMAPAFRFAMAERYAEAIGARYGRSINVLSWDWNGVTMRSLRPSRNDADALEQGWALGAALLRLGVDPARVHLIGQSSGCLVVTAAARILADARGRQVARLTLLDPAGGHHRWIFGRLGANSAAAVVEHYWAPGLSGFGKPAPYPGVRDQAVPGPRGARGLLRPFHTDHLHTVRWHIGRIGG